MPQPPPLARHVRESIAAQIGRRAARSFGPEAGAATPAAPALGESLRVMMLPPVGVEAGGRLADLLVDTGQWHHQIHDGGRAAGFARSVPAAGESAGAAGEAAHRVVEVVRSDLPEALGETIAWADSNLPGEAAADLVLAPAYGLTALWIHGDGRDLVVVASKGRSIRDIPLNAPLEADDFLRRLAANRPIAGLGPLPGEGR